MGCDGLVDGPKGIVASVTDGDTVVLDNGLVVRLIGTQAPKLPLGREDFETWPKAEEARVRARKRWYSANRCDVRHGGEQRRSARPDAGPDVRHSTIRETLGAAADDRGRLGAGLFVPR